MSRKVPRGGSSPADGPSPPGGPPLPPASSSPGGSSPPGAPSARDRFEPYGARVRLTPGNRDLEPAPLLAGVLEDIASGCEAAGATLIGHIKCVMRTERGRISCGLTSVRAGARCAGDTDGLLAEGEEAEVRLAVLVYGLVATTIDEIVEAALESRLGSAGCSWSKRAFFGGQG